MTVTRTELVAAPLAPDASHVRLVRVEIPAGEPTGRHRHPCDVVGYVLSGTARYQQEGGDEQLLHSGDGFIEPKDVVIAAFDNASSTEPLVFLAQYLLATPDTALIEVL